MAGNNSDSRMLWIGAVAGLIVMVLLNSIVLAITTTIISLFSTLIGGFVAGWIAGGGAKNGGISGLFAGLLNAVLMAVLITFFGLRPENIDWGLLTLLGSTFLITVVLFPLWGFLGYLGGALGGKVKD